MAIRMQQTENITKFTKRFWTVYSKVENVGDKLTIKTFKQFLLPGNELRKNLVRFPLVSMKALMARVNQFIEQEDNEARAPKNFGLWQDKAPASSAEALAPTSKSNGTSSSEH